MISIIIDNETKQSPASWDKITFERFLSYFDKVASKEPKELTAFVSEHFEAIAEIDEKLSQRQKETVANRLFTERWLRIWDKDKAPIYKYFALEVGFWCGVDDKLILEQVPLETLEAAFWSIQYEMNPDNATINKDYTGFEIGGIEYLCPPKHMAGSTAIEFIAAAQYQHFNAKVQGGQWKAMLDVLVVLCRPKGESYDGNNTALTNRRKELFKQLPMTDVINVAFFLHRLNDSLKTNLAIYTAKEELARLQAKSLARTTDG